MTAEVIDSSSTVNVNVNTEKEPEESEKKMETSQDEQTSEETAEEQPQASTDVNGKGGKRKRSAKKPVEVDETSISNSRPKRSVSKREDPPAPVNLNGSVKTQKNKVLQSSTEPTSTGDVDDEQEREKAIPIVHDVADVVWVKMGGHPWWPSLIVRDPNDSTQCFTKITGSARAKRMYFVVFYGSTADFAWVSDAAVISYKGVEAFTQYAQEMVDKAQTKSQKEQLTERFQLKVTIGRREDWEAAVREADTAQSQTSEKRLEEIEPKVQFYMSKLQNGRRGGGNFNDLADRSDLAEKIDDFDSDDESSDENSTAPAKTKSRKQSSHDSDEGNTPPAKRRPARKSNGSQDDTSAATKKRGRPRLSKPAVISNNTESLRKSITKPQAFMNEKTNIMEQIDQVYNGQHHRYDIRTGFLSPFEEKLIFDAVDQLRSTKTFDEAEKIARQRFEQILCVNLNKTNVDIPVEWFYSFLFAHPILIIKNPHWFDKKVSIDDLKSNPSKNSTDHLKHQLIVLSKLYRNEIRVRPATD